MKSKLFILLMLLTLSIIIIACSSDEDTSSSSTDTVEKTTNNSSDDTVKQPDNSQDSSSKDEATQDTTNNETSETSSLSNSATLNNVTYTILSSKVLDPNEYTLEDDGTKAVLVSMNIVNNTDKLINVSSLFFDIIGESGEDYGVELMNGITKGSLDSFAAPGRIITGEFLIYVNENDTKFTLEYSPELLSDDMISITFNDNSDYDVVEITGSSEGKGFGDELLDETLRYVINSATIETKGDRSYILINLTANNPTASEISLDWIPFSLIASDGYLLSMDVSTLRDALYSIPANGSKDTQISFTLDANTSKDFDLYVAIFGQVKDYMHFKLE